MQSLEQKKKKKDKMKMKIKIFFLLVVIVIIYINMIDIFLNYVSYAENDDSKNVLILIEIYFYDKEIDCFFFDKIYDQYAFNVIDFFRRQNLAIIYGITIVIVKNTLSIGWTFCGVVGFIWLVWAFNKIYTDGADDHD